MEKLTKLRKTSILQDNLENLATNINVKFGNEKKIYRNEGICQVCKFEKMKHNEPPCYNTQFMSELIGRRSDTMLQKCTFHA
jgi:hypothetical protein